MSAGRIMPADGLSAWALERGPLSASFGRLLAVTTPLPDIAPASDERSTLTSFLDFQRSVARRKTEGLDDQQLRTRLAGHPSMMSIGAIIKHLASCETWWARGCFAGQDVGELDEPWRSGWQQAEGDWEWEADADSGKDLRAWFDKAIANANSTYSAAPTLDELSVRAWGAPTSAHVNLRWILVHLIEEYARHLGHLDLLREQIDGNTGD